MDTTLRNENISDLFNSYQEASEKKFNGHSLTSHQGADYLYISSRFERAGTQSYGVEVEEFFQKANMRQITAFQNFLRDVTLRKDILRVEI